MSILRVIFLSMLTVIAKGGEFAYIAYPGYCTSDGADLNLEKQRGSLDLLSCQVTCNVNDACSGIEYYASRNSGCYLVTESRRANGSVTYEGAVCYVKSSSAIPSGGCAGLTDGFPAATCLLYVPLCNDHVFHDWLAVHCAETCCKYA